MDAKQSYQDKTSCNNCGGNNTLLDAIIHDNVIYEVTTNCKDCGFDDYWSHGFFIAYKMVLIMQSVFFD